MSRTKNGPRIFSDAIAERVSVPLLIGIVGPTGAGKSYSALELATGIQSVVGGDIYAIDTEASRLLHYADRFSYRHVPFDPPFDPLSYLSAVEHCERQGAKTIIIDSASHMHEGVGGTLWAQQAELDRLAGDDWKKRERCGMLAWARPKADLRSFLNAILQKRINIIFCFRAKEKMEMIQGAAPIKLGFKPISGDEMFYEMTASLLLYPGSKGVPTLESEEIGERTSIKIPAQFEGVFRPSQPIHRDHGRKLAEWATGGAAAPPRLRPENVVHTAPQPETEPVPLASQGRDLSFDARPIKDIIAAEIALIDGCTATPQTIRDAMLAWAQDQGIAVPRDTCSGLYQRHRDAVRHWIGQAFDAIAASTAEQSADEPQDEPGANG
jgi:hypothetical protein